MRPILRIWPVLAAGLWLSWPAHGQSSETAERGATTQCTSAAKAKPSGLVVLLPSGERNYQTMNLQVLNNPFMNGVAVQINWRDIEPDQGKPDWTQLDALFAAAEAAKKWVHLIMFPGFFSPAWALEGAQTDLFKIQYGPGKGTDAKLPMPWDRVYLDRWFTFMKLLSARYGRSPAFRMIAAAGPTSVSVEMTSPNSLTAHEQWLKDSYTPAKYLGAGKTLFTSMPERSPISAFLWQPRACRFLDQGQRGSRHICAPSWK
jgi:hypothetical protein